MFRFRTQTIYASHNTAIRMQVASSGCGAGNALAWAAIFDFTIAAIYIYGVRGAVVCLGGARSCVLCVLL